MLALGNAEDVLIGIIGISTGGNSKNVGAALDHQFFKR